MLKINNSSRLSYQLMTRDDVQLLFEMDQDVEVMKYITNGKKTTMEEVNDIYIPRMEKYTNIDNGWGIWKTSIKQTGICIGWILVRPFDFFGNNPQYENLELGWRFQHKSWGHGYASEAAITVKDALIEHGDVKIFSAIAVKENKASIRIMQKLGMQYIKHYIEHSILGETEVVYYSIDVC